VKGLSDNWPLLLGVVVALALLILLALVLLLRKAAKVSHVSDNPDDDEEESAPAAGKRADGSARIGAAFRRARGHLRQRGAGDRYATPLVVLLGAEGSRERGFLEHAGAGMEVREDPVRAGMAFGDGQEFLLFDKGVVLDVAGEPVLGADGRTADDGSWKSIVRQLVEMRPKRPLDAIVVTVGCKDLLDAAGDEAKRLALADRADRVRKRLWELQDASGFRLPLYVLVTSCEELDGFHDTCAALTAGERTQILGWSSPHGANVPYQTTWIEEAFRELRGALGHLQMKLFRDAPRGEGVLLLPWSVAALAVPLRTFLDQLLSPGARHEAALTRGMYFCGNYAETKTTAFVAELFDQKIFHETGLATPTSAIRLTRSRRARVLRAVTVGTAAAVAAGLFFAQQTLSGRRHQLLQDALQNSFQDMRAMPTMTDGQLGDAGEKLVDRISAVAFEHYSPWWLPASWLSGFDHREHQALGHAFEVIVLNAIKERINLKASSVIQAFRTDAAMRIRPSDDAGAAEASLEPVERSEELLVLKKFVADMREIERQGTMFNRVAAVGSHDEAALAANVKFAFDKELPPSFYRQAGMYGLVERGLPPDELFHPDRYQKGATEAAEIGMAALFSKFFEHNPVAARVALVAHGIDPKSLQLAGRRELDTAAVQRLDNTFHTLQKDLSTPSTAWAFRSSFDLGADLNQILDSIGRSEMFAPGTEKILRNGGASQLQALQARLGARTGIDTPVLKLRADRTPVMELSHDSDLLHTAIEAFLGQSFVVRQTEAHPIRTSVEGRRLVWDPAQLEQAAIAYRAYKDFGERGMKLFPRDFPIEASAAIEQTAQQRTREQLADLLGQAQRFEPVTRPLTAAANEEELRLETAAFDSSAKSIHAQLDALRSMHAEETRNQVIAATSAEAMRLLRAVDDLLKKSAAYRPRTGSFEWWDGTAPPAPSGWGGRDAAQLAEYLDTTRDRVAALANGYAAPMLAWFAEFGGPSDDDDARVVAQWRTISNDLHNFEAKKPGNAPAMLEDYIAERAAKVTPADCRAAELKPGERAARSAM
jgi:type VI secretion system protein ImpL